MLVWLVCHPRQMQHDDIRDHVFLDDGAHKMQHAAACQSSRVVSDSVEHSRARGGTCPCNIEREQVKIKQDKQTLLSQSQTGVAQWCSLLFLHGHDSVSSCLTFQRGKRRWEAGSSSTVQCTAHQRGSMVAAQVDQVRAPHCTCPCHSYRDCGKRKEDGNMCGDRATCRSFCGACSFSDSSVSKS